MSRALNLRLLGDNCQRRAAEARYSEQNPQFLTNVAGRRALDRPCDPPLSRKDAKENGEFRNARDVSKRAVDENKRKMLNGQIFPLGLNLNFAH